MSLSERSKENINLKESSEKICIKESDELDVLEGKPQDKDQLEKEKNNIVKCTLESEVLPSTVVIDSNEGSTKNLDETTLAPSESKHGKLPTNLHDDTKTVIVVSHLDMEAIQPKPSIIDSKADSVEDLGKNKITALENKPEKFVNSFYFQLTKQDKASGPGIILSKDDNRVYNFDEKCPPVPYCEDFETLSISQRKIHVYEVSRHYIIRVYDSSRETVLGPELARKYFVYKILITVFIQLIVSFGISFTCFYVKALGGFVQETLGFFLLIFATQLICFIVLLCMDNARREGPANYFLLTIFTLTSGYLLGYITLLSSEAVMIESVLATLGSALFISLIAWVNMCDFTNWNFAIDILVLITLVYYSIASIYYFVTRNAILLYIFYCLFYLVMCLSLLHQMELIFGKRKHAMHTEEFLLAGVIVYIETLAIYASLLFVVLGPT